MCLCMYCLGAKVEIKVMKIPNFMLDDESNGDQDNSADDSSTPLGSSRKNRITVRRLMGAFVHEKLLNHAPLFALIIANVLFVPTENEFQVFTVRDR